MAEQKEAEKMLRKSLKDTKQSQKYLRWVEIYFIISMLMFGAACVVYAKVAIPDKPQPTDEISEGCISCAKQMPTDCTTFFDNLPEECETCVGRMEEEECDKEYYVEWIGSMGITVLLYIGVVVFYILFMLVGSARKIMEIKQLKIEHALEIDKLKKRRK